MILEINVAIGLQHKEIKGLGKTSSKLSFISEKSSASAETGSCTVFSINPGTTSDSISWTISKIVVLIVVQASLKMSDVRLIWQLLII